MKYSNLWPKQTIVSDQSELTILLCQPMNSLLLMKTTLPWYSGLQLVPSHIYNPCIIYNLNIATINCTNFAAKPDVTLTIKDSDLVDLMSGKLNSQKAFFQGKLKVMNVEFRILTKSSLTLVTSRIKFSGIQLNFYYLIRCKGIWVWRWSYKNFKRGFQNQSYKFYCRAGPLCFNLFWSEYIIFHILCTVWQI